MAEVVVLGTRLPLRKQAATELTARAAQRAEYEADKVLLASPATQMSLCFDDLDPAQAERVAPVIVAAATEMRQEIGAPGAPADEVEMAAQLTAIGMLVARAYHLPET